MGIILEEFGSNKYDNEAEVNQNFIVPLLRMLGYLLTEIIPENNFPIFNVTLNRNNSPTSDKLPKNQRPDFVICLENLRNPIFVVESKAPKENLIKHGPQSRAYAIGVKVNIIVSTNGNEFLIYDVNHLIFEAKSIEELDLKFYCLKQILSKDAHKSHSPLEIIQNIDLEKSLSKTIAKINDDEAYRKKLKLSDFEFYLENVRDDFKNWQVPNEFQFGDNFDFQQFPPDELLKFQDSDPDDNSFLNIKDDVRFSLADIEEKVKSKSTIFIGNSGIGKTTLLKYITWVKSNECLHSLHSLIPIYIQLRNYGLNNSIQSLILHFFVEKGFNISEVQFHDYLKKNEFIFLFDAYDEVQEKYLEDLQRELTQFLNICNHRVIITSRNIRVPRLSCSSLFYVRPLEKAQIQELSKQYFGDKWYQFYNEIQTKGLEVESRNTLLLTFMIFIYEKYGLVPASKTKIIKKVIDNLEKWEINKGKRFVVDLSWKFKTKLLSELAFIASKEHQSLLLTKKETDDIIFPIIEDCEKSREIPCGIERQSLINNLISTGIICENLDGISFWHTAFFEYFASMSLATKYTKNSAIIEDIKTRVWWEPIIIGAAGFLEDSSAYVESILETNLYAATLCLLESKNIDISLVNKIKSKLKSNCESSIIEIRQRGIYFLSKIEERYPSKLLFDIIIKNPYVDVKQIALEQIAITKSDQAKDIVYSLIDRNEVSTLITPTTAQGSVAKALSNFGEDEHLIIINIWKKNTDIFTSSACREALINIVRRNELSEKVKESLFDFYLEPLDKRMLAHKKSDLAKIIIEVGDVLFIPKLIQSIKHISDEEKEYEFLWGSEEILASFESNDVIKQLISYAVDENQSNILRGYCTGALSKSKGKIDISVFETLVENDNLFVRRNAINGLRKYPALEVKEILFRHINDEDGEIQYDIIEILGEKELLVELVEKNLFPIKFYYSTVESYLKQIKKYSLHKLVPTLTELSIIVKENKRLLIQIAETYNHLSEENKAKKIIESFYDGDKFILDDQVLYDIIRAAPKFDSPYSIKLINRVLKSFNTLEEKSAYEYWCSEALGKIGGADSVELLKKMVEEGEYEKNGLLIESVFRSLNPLVSIKDEDWYVDFLESNPSLSNTDLHRIIEGLGRIGTEKSIKKIRETAKLYRENSYILNVCFRSLENIMFSSGKITNVQEEDLF